MRDRVEYYDQDGKPIEGGTLAWADLFEKTAERIVGQTKTLYGEKLSTVWLGLDHQFGNGLPLIFETMLFAPTDHELRWRIIRAFPNDPAPDDDAKQKTEEEYIRKHYPHDQLQLRYSSKLEARRSFEKLRLQCLIPPRWRRFILYTIGRDYTWA